MSQKRLNYVILQHTHRDRMDLLELREIAHQLVSVNEQ